MFGISWTRLSTKARAAFPSNASVMTSRQKLILRKAKSVPRAGVLQKGSLWKPEIDLERKPGLSVDSSNQKRSRMTRWSRKLKRPRQLKRLTSLFPMRKRASPAAARMKNLPPDAEAGAVAAPNHSSLRVKPGEPTARTKRLKRKSR